MKLAVSDIDWKACRAAVKDQPLETGLVRMAEIACRNEDTYIVTGGFLNRASPLFYKAVTSAFGGTPPAMRDMQDRFPVLPKSRDSRVIQIENDAGKGPATASVIYLKPPYMALFSTPTGGCMFTNIETGKYRIPEAFNIGRDTASTSHYMTTMHEVCAMLTFFEDIPEVVRAEKRPSRRVVRKGRTVRQPAHRIITMHPGAERVVTERIAEVQRQRAKRGPMVEHEVRQHFLHYNLDPACHHVWTCDDYNAVPLRQVCQSCGGKRTLRKPFKRGDPIKKKPQKIIVIK